MVLVLSENANASPHIEREIAHAFYTGRKIIPLRLTNTLPRRDFLFYLGDIRSLDAFGLPAEQQLEALTASVSGLVSGRTVTRDAMPQHSATKTTATLNFSDSWIGTFRASHYRTLEILKRVAIAASIVGVVWLFLFVREETKHEVSPEEGNRRSMDSDPGGHLASSHQASGDTSVLKPAYTFTRFGLWAAPNTSATPSIQHGSQDSLTNAPVPLPASTTPATQPGFDQKTAAEAESLRTRDSSSLKPAREDPQRMAARHEGHRRKSRPKGQNGRVRASEGSLVAHIENRLNALWHQIVERGKENGSR